MDKYFGFQYAGFRFFITKGEESAKCIEGIRKYFTEESDDNKEFANDMAEYIAGEYRIDYDRLIAAVTLVEKLWETPKSSEDDDDEGGEFAES